MSCPLLCRQSKRKSELILRFHGTFLERFDFFKKNFPFLMQNISSDYCILLFAFILSCKSIFCCPVLWLGAVCRIKDRHLNNYFLCCGTQNYHRLLSPRCYHTPSVDFLSLICSLHFWFPPIFWPRSKV